MGPIINVSILHSKSNGNPANRPLANTDQVLIGKMWKFFGVFYDFLLAKAIKESSAIILSLYNWINSHQTRSSTNYSPGTIINVDLGLGYGYELSYRHPCIVLADDGGFNVYVVPCSSGKYGKFIPSVLDATTADGFTLNTGCMIDSAKWIQKVRINRSLGQVSPTFYKKLCQSVFNYSHPDIAKQLAEECMIADALFEELLQEQYYSEILTHELQCVSQHRIEAEQYNAILEKKISSLKMASSQ